ncbi:hypothetical protein JIG36_39270 [Actinoplanes sp. LDG1-06]|uniref:Uncharacterized protein n=1 Tax=Paractinoplanes ovalisporus TaxID=2810368 RepID=A0ABS2AP24_9ACTN|nr:hypothetical protein [Actinoplanes ovalisporus]MBM2621564.1 hypothetical protein [Actinoplanes ovalisporus]
MRIDTRAWLIALTWAVPTVLLVAVGVAERGFAGCSVVFGLILGWTTAIAVNRALHLRALVRWAAAGHWVPVDPRSRQWPWHDLHLKGSSRVRFAWSGELHGMLITFGQVRWKGGAFGAASSSFEGNGVFVVVRLPLEEPPMAMRLPMVVVGDSPRLEQPLLRQSFLAGEIPPFTVRGHELFTLEPRDSWPDIDSVKQAVRRALRVVHLLDVGPDTPW